MGKKKVELENRRVIIKKIENLIKQYTWMIYKVNTKLYEKTTETIIDDKVVKVRTFRVLGENKKEFLALKDRLKKEKAVLEQALFELKQNNKKWNTDSKDSGTHITVKERRFMIRTSNNDCINPYANTIYRDVHKEKNVTTKSSVWPVGWPMKK